MKVTIIKNGILQMVLTPEDELEKEVIKKLNGGTVQVIADNNTILNNNVGGGLLIKQGDHKSVPEKQ